MECRYFYQDTKGKTLLISHLEIPSVYMPPNAQTCLDAQSLGLDHVKPNPALQYEIDLGKNVFCEGDIIHPIVRSQCSIENGGIFFVAQWYHIFNLAEYWCRKKIDSELDLGSF